MYFYLSILILLCILFCLLFHFRKNRILRRVCSMAPEKKLCLLSSLIEPAGFCYRREQDIFSSRKDAWQRRFGYRSLYDRTAPLGQMVFQCEPVYFNYGHKTWLIELWKGQYGINTGAEIGVYHADAVISPDGYKNARFQAASDEELLSMKLELWKGDRKLFEAEACHWWLTGFRMGLFSWPECLRMDVSITFPCREMADAFLQSLLDMGYDPCQVSSCLQTVSFRFAAPRSPQPCRKLPLTCAFSQWKNRIFCRLFNRITRPFDCTLDRLLYLYYYLPAAFRRTVSIRRKRCYTRRRLL